METTSTIGNSTALIEIEEGRGDEVTKEIETAVHDLKGKLPADISVTQFSTNQSYEFFMDLSRKK
ncbi:hypothetical protein H1Z61_14790 [Bacillus aquiflavi]|uniref:Efflux RND transporter permease subunit n=1 Tax=Bacillus aquiflavi TaxID=2672567 RepID=A0A6B3VXA8_9BACI|nr:hypothetical protein [Bacillus aquiflavi]MBA4538364.1 hypothetical protein [Bacillus aquiflavi]NEY82729.1 hypothetical protein [Bacillus aquiflavi]UAC49522.1 hypothetical protein K6959_06755 [Bacillus aquiflavi]